MSVEAHVETEQKFEIGSAADVPSLLELSGVATVDAAVAQDLEAVYYDTAELDLAGAGITLRRRTGGADAGWHLKLPFGGHEREELRLPLGSVPEIPDALLERTRVVRRDEPAFPVATISTKREVHRLRDARGRVLAELADDRVLGVRVPSGVHQTWREWEVELVEGTSALLERTGELLLTAGAAPAVASSKLARVLGNDPIPVARPAEIRTAGDLLAAYLRHQFVQLRQEDPLVRAGAPDAVHKMRVAARRARSALATFAPLLEPGSCKELVDDLRWLGSRLGEARDAEVLEVRMAALLGDESDRRPIARGIADELADRTARGEVRARQALASDRYRGLLDSLDACAASPPLHGAVRGLEAVEVVDLVARDWKRLRLRAHWAALAPSGEPRDHALHDVRKAAKRLRYAAECAVPVLGQRARTLAMSSTALQDVLGEHHDSVVARDLLRRVQGQLGAGESDDSGRLWDARESARAQALERDYEAVVDILMRGHPGPWLRPAPHETVPA